MAEILFEGRFANVVADFKYCSDCSGEFYCPVLGAKSRVRSMNLSGLEQYALYSDLQFSSSVSATGEHPGQHVTLTCTKGGSLEIYTEINKEYKGKLFGTCPTKI